MAESKRKKVNFILISTPEPEPLDFPYMEHANYPRYPSNWSKVSWLIRKMAGFRCVWCGNSHRTRTHHMGVPFPDDPQNKPGCRYDKHDLRVENLYCLCEVCERKADKLFPCPRPDKSVYAADHLARSREQELRRIRKHRALGLGTGLTLWQPPQSKVW